MYVEFTTLYSYKKKEKRSNFVCLTNVYKIINILNKLVREWRNRSDLFTLNKNYLYLSINNKYVKKKTFIIF